ncbi:DnaD domain protein [Pediococcus parvulus]|uniref:DnaD domain protein n=1 Tax=Pediococcus parvulus TaxID=54062 RepID=UPI00070C0AC5|nr:DnaD domain protein [Pediococcus parvulus]MCT3027339.1 DnaD domain protein [Pediococcus parvulus]GEL89310.1 replication protein DnaD [Pediococcus parvulus]GHC07397.1 replication protein DnaD [Pediococcus parvulus]
MADNKTEERPNYYSILPANVRYDLKLSANAKLLYSEITALCNKSGTCWSTNAYFAKLYQVNNWTVSSWINQLKQQGYIFVKFEYFPKTKQISKRIISLNPVKSQDNTHSEKSQGVIRKITGGYSEKSQRGIVKNPKENITSINTTSTNKDKEEGNSNTKINSETQIERKAVFVFWENNGFGLASPTLYQNIDYEVDDFKKLGLVETVAYELIRYALRVAVDHNARTWSYVRTILSGYQQKNLKSVEQVKASEKQFKAKYAKQRPSSSNSIPDRGEYDNDEPLPF